MNIITRLCLSFRRRLLSIASIKTLAVFRHDLVRFSRYAGCYRWREKEAAKARMIMAYHVIEKGLTMPRRRFDFGHEAVLNLISIVDEFNAKFGDDAQAQHAAGVVKAYKELHEVAGFRMDANDPFWKTVLNFCKRYGVDVAVQKHFTKASFFADKSKSFPEFARSRHTVRHFVGNVADGDLKSIIGLAMTAPSACNRQHVRVHCVSSAEKKAQVLALQHGNRGFGADADRILVVTVDLEDVRWAEERNDIYTNAGIFLMNLCYAIHYYGYGSCILNWSVDSVADKKLRHLLPTVLDRESVVVLVAVGSVPETFDVASSPRKALSEILFYED